MNKPVKMAKAMTYIMKHAIVSYPVYFSYTHSFYTYSTKT